MTSAYTTVTGCSATPAATTVTTTSTTTLSYTEPSCEPETCGTEACSARIKAALAKPPSKGLDRRGIPAYGDWPDPSDYLSRDQFIGDQLAKFDHFDPVLEFEAGYEPQIVRHGT